MKVSIELGAYHALKRRLRENIRKEVKAFLGFLPIFKVVSIGVSVTSQVWVRLEVETNKFDNIKEE